MSLISVLFVQIGPVDARALMVGSLLHEFQHTDPSLPQQVAQMAVRSLVNMREEQFRLGPGQDWLPTVDLTSSAAQWLDMYDWSRVQAVQWLNHIDFPAVDSVAASNALLRRLSVEYTQARSPAAAARKLAAMRHLLLGLPELELVSKYL